MNTIALYEAVGIRVKQDWSGAYLVEGDAPEFCPVCGQPLTEYERLDSGDWNTEILFGCPNVEHEAVWQGTENE